MDFVESVSIGAPTVTIDGQAFTGDFDKLFTTDEPHILSVLNQFRAFNLARDYRQDKWQSDWQVVQLVQIQQSGLSGSASRTLWSHAILWHALRVSIALPFVFLVVTFYLQSRIARKHQRVLGGQCPSCLYSLRGVQDPRCPECGLDVLREARLLLCLHTDGYRGLKRFMAMEREGAK